MMGSERARSLLVALGSEIEILYKEGQSCSEEKIALEKEVHELKALLALGQWEMAKHPVPDSERSVTQCETPLPRTPSKTSLEANSNECTPPEEHRPPRPSITEYYMERNRPSQPRKQKSNLMEWGDDLSDRRVGKHRKHLQRIVSSPIVDMAVGGLIVFNTFCMAGEIQYQGINTGYALGFQNYDSPTSQNWNYASKVFEVLDKVFIIVFGLELALRFIAFRLEVFKEPLNYVDMVAVGAGILNWTLNSERSLDNMLLRMLRVAKLVARSLRLLKLTKFVESLHILVKSISASMWTLLWSVVLLLMFQFVAGMMLSQLVQPIIMDEAKDIRSRHQVFSYYGIAVSRITRANTSRTIHVF